MSTNVMRVGLVGAMAAVLLGGCTYDYLQRSDKVSYSSGNAVKANLEGQTTNPSVSKKTTGLGKDGVLITPATPTTTP